MVYIIDPEDYAAEVLDDPWDMTEVTPPAWNTTDIDSLTGCWGSCSYTDSISGMFEWNPPAELCSGYYLTRIDTPVQTCYAVILV